MIRPVIHFAHANGFPSGSYGKIFRLLEPEFDVLHVDMFAHNPEFPVVPNWEPQADQLIRYLENKADMPVIGIGHSFGASVTFMAAVKRPDLFRGLILMEPILFLGPFRWLVLLAKWAGFIDRVSPAGKTKNRIRKWPDRETAQFYFKSRAFFKRFDPECLEDYLRYGLVEKNGEWHLRFTVEKELEIFRNGPLHFGKYKGRLKDMPGTVISGKHTDAIPIPVVRRFAGQQSFDFTTVDGGHMFPLEQPVKTAEWIAQITQTFL